MNTAWPSGELFPPALRDLMYGLEDSGWMHFCSRFCRRFRAFMG